MKPPLLLLCFSIVTASGAQRILMSRLGPAEASLMISNADGSAEQTLTKGALDYDPAWSADGKWIAFTSEREGPANLFRMHSDGNGVERLTNYPAYDDQASFAPDGKQIVFVSTRETGKAHLWILDVNTKAVRALTSSEGSDFRPAWSPDGQWIAFSSDRDSTLPFAKGRWEHLHVVDIYLVHPDGTGLKRISKHGDFCGSPKWEPTSRSVIAYCMAAEDTWTFRAGPREGETTIMRIDVTAGTATPVAAGPGVKLFASTLPSGEVGFLRKDTKAFGIYYSSGKKGPEGDVRWPAWSPDGSKVVYGRAVTSPPGTVRKLWSRNAKYELINAGIFPNYDARGERYAASALLPQNSSALQVTTGNTPAKTIKKTTGELMIAPAWSPKRDQLVFGIGQFSAFLDFTVGAVKPPSAVNGGAQIAVIRPDGADFRIISSGPNNNGFPTFSPDGKQVVYRTMGPEGEGLRILDLESGRVSVVTSGYDNFPVWSPRGDLIAFVRRVDNDFEVHTVRPDGKDVKRLTRAKGNDAHLNWSPDGERIMFSTTRMGFKDEALYTSAPQPYGELFVMKYDGTELEQLTDNQWEDAGPAWQPQSK
jgi:Tol biopolymer transport system component